MSTRAKRTARLPAERGVPRIRSQTRLTFTEIDALLKLPAGAARRRRLVVLTVRAPEIAGTPFRSGDRLIVEPGDATPLGRFVACRAAREVALYVTALTRRGDVVLLPASPDALPLEFAKPSNVMGVVIGAVRRSRGEDFVGAPPRYEFATGVRPTRTADTDETSETVQSILALLETIASDFNATRPHAARGVLAAAFRIRTLDRCMRAVAGARLYAALAVELDQTVSRLRRILKPQDRGSAELRGLHLALRITAYHRREPSMCRQPTSGVTHSAKTSC